MSAPELDSGTTASSEPPGIPVYLDSRPPCIVDPARPAQEGEWHPADDATIKLLRCVEAIRDIVPVVKALLSSDDPTDRRLQKALVVPTYNLAICVRELFHGLHSTQSEYSRWKRLHHKEQLKLKLEFRSFEKVAPTKGSDFKTVRDKLSAHIDKDVIGDRARSIWNTISIEQVVQFLSASLRMLLTILELDLFSWTREAEHPGLTILMNVDGSEVTLHGEGEELAIVRVCMTRSPREAVAREVVQLIELTQKARDLLGFRQAVVIRLKKDAEAETLTPEQAAIRNWAASQHQHWNGTPTGSETTATNDDTKPSSSDG